MGRLRRVSLQNFRCHPRVEILPSDSRWVALRGGNGAGKTSILEAVFSACRGRSFRTTASTEMIRTQAPAAEIFLEGSDPRRRLHARYGRPGKELRLDGEKAQFSEAMTLFPVDYVNGATCGLLQGAPKDRRRFVDWVLFHVEPRFWESWRNWRRAERQRNHLLRRQQYDALAPWTALVAEAGEELTEWRRLFMNSLQHELRNASGDLPQAQNLRIRFIPGWRAETLRQAMDQHKQNERRIGRSVVGPQRDDWTVMVGDQPARLMSRGQMKLVGLLLVRARGRLMQQAGRGSILLLDDLPADMDAQSLRLAVNLLQDGFIQIWLSWVSGINGDQALAPCDVEWFHVEPGLVQKST